MADFFDTDPWDKKQAVVDIFITALLVPLKLLQYTTNQWVFYQLSAIPRHIRCQLKQDVPIPSELDPMCRSSVPIPLQPLASPKQSLKPRLHRLATIALKAFYSLGMNPGAFYEAYPRNNIGENVEKKDELKINWSTEDGINFNADSSQLISLSDDSEDEIVNFYML